MEQTQATFDATNVITKEQEIKFNYKTFAKDSKGYNAVMALIDEGKLSKDLVEFNEKDGTLKRKSVVVKTDIPVINIEGYTPEMNAHIEFLITKQVEAKNKEAVDNCLDEWKSWHEVLQAAPIQRSGGAIAVSKEMVDAVTDTLTEWATESGMPAKGVEVIKAAATRRFSAASLVGLPTAHVEKIKTLVEQFKAVLDDDSLEVATPVLNLWLGNLDKILNPEEELEEDLFDF